MSSAIRDVDETLIELLRNDPIVTIPDAQIALISRAEANANGVRLTLFLYSICPAAEYRNELESSTRSVSLKSSHLSFRCARQKSMRVVASGTGHSRLRQKCCGLFGFHSPLPDRNVTGAK